MYIYIYIYITFEAQPCRTILRADVDAELGSALCALIRVCL